LLLLDGLDVGEILRPACGSLIFDECRAPDHRDLPAFQCETRTLGNSFVEGDTVSAIQNVDAPRGNPICRTPLQVAKSFALTSKVLSGAPKSASAR
jgi:hypothetical protein